MSKNYIISEKRLLELLEAEARLQCLERDGVDNWEWYMESCDQFIADCLGVEVKDVDEQSLDFEDVAIAGLAEFKEF